MRWEYRFERVSLGRSVSEPRRDATGMPMNDYRYFRVLDYDRLTDTIEAAARDGWRLVTREDLPGDERLLVFEREVPIKPIEPIDVTIGSGRYVHGPETADLIARVEGLLPRINAFFDAEISRAVASGCPLESMSVADVEVTGEPRRRDLRSGSYVHAYVTIRETPNAIEATAFRRSDLGWESERLLPIEGADVKGGRR